MKINLKKKKVTVRTNRAISGRRQNGQISVLVVFFSPFSIAITSLGEERANLSAFRTFVRFVLKNAKREYFIDFYAQLEL